MSTTKLILIGGPFDGAHGLVWCDESEPPPTQIVVDRCRGGCGMVGCDRQPRHVAYWDPLEQTDADGAPYTRVSCDGRRAEYVHGGVDLSSYLEAGYRELATARMGDD